jgi:hypothetical protein
VKAILALGLLFPAVASAHPGHGGEASTSPLTYVAAIAIGLAVGLFAMRRARA